MSTVMKATSVKDRPNLTQPVVYSVVIAALALLPLFVSSPYLLHILILTLVYIMATSSMRLIMISGQFNLAHAAFMGIGAYFSAVVSRWVGLSPWITIPAGAFVAMGVGMFVAYPFARLRTFYFAMVSLFFGTGIVSLIKALGKLTGGYQGLSDIPPLLDVASKVPYYYIFLIACVISLAVMYRLEFSRYGLSLRAIDQSYQVAGSVAINEGKYRITVMGFGCFFVGLAGAIYGHYNMSLSPTSFDMTATLWLVMYTLIGGIGHFAGPIIGTTILLLIPEVFRGAKQYTPFFSAAILFLVIFIIPNGLVSIPGLVRGYLKERKAKEVSR
jgi:branched-chain amino acid transport system permease protein